jgi:hypothetical protein
MVGAIWTDPTSPTIDVPAGNIVGKTNWDAFANNFLWLAGTTGKPTQLVVQNGSTNGPTTTSGVLVDLPDMTLNLTTQGRDILAILVATMSHSAAGGTINTVLNLDSGVSAGATMTGGSAAINLPFIMVNMIRFAAPAAGSHNVKVQWSCSTGTATASSTQRILALLEMR